MVLGHHEAPGWTYFYLYVILDIFSRYAVGWMVAHRERTALAERLITATCEKQAIGAGQLTIRADRGTSMMSKPIALLLADLGVTRPPRPDSKGVGGGYGDYGSLDRQG